MFILQVSIFALLVFFVVAQVYVEAINEGPDCHWWRESMSHYLGQVRHAGLQAIAYLGFAAALLMMMRAYPHGTAWNACLVVAAGGLLGVTVTGISSPEWTWHPQMERAHVICSGLAFGGALVGQVIYLWHTPMLWFPVGAMASTLAFVRFAPDRNALEEKCFAGWIVGGFIAIAGLPF